MPSADETTHLFGLLFNLIFGTIIVFLVCLVLQLIGSWKTYKKIGLEPWACLIPVYTVWALASRLVERKIAIAATVTAAIAFVLQYFNTNLDDSYVVHVLLGIAAIVTLVFDCIIKDKLSKEFGYGTGFTVGLVLLPFIFFLILGFGSAMPSQANQPLALPSGSVEEPGEDTLEDNSPFTTD